MKKTVRFFSLALAIIMLIPMLSVFPVKVSATGTSYDGSRDGELLRTVNFNAPEWKQGFYNNDNCDATASVSGDGTSVGFTVTAEKYKRAIWGGFYPGAGVDEDEYEEALGEVQPMEIGAKYTLVFDLTLGNNNVGFGIMADGNNDLLIRGNGQSQWYQWNTSKVGETADNNEKWNYHTAPGSSTRDRHTFAVTVDYDAKTMALYVLDESDGAFYFCRSITYDGSGVWDSAYLRCRFYVRSLSGTPDESYTADVSNLNIYKGNALSPLFGDGYRLSYWSRDDGEKLLDVNFNAPEWKQGFYNENNCGAIADVSGDGTSVDFTVTTDSYKRAIWGGFYPGAGVDEDEFDAGLGALLPMSTGAKYTLVFDLTLGSDNVAFGIMADGNNDLLIRGNGQSQWYQWNTSKVGETADNNEKWNYHTAPGSSTRDRHTFAVTVDYDAKTMALYVLDESDGAFYFCRSIAYDGSGVWDSAYFRCRFYVRSMSGTPNANYTANLGNLKIYKGNAMNHLWNNVYTLPYDSHADGDKLLKVDFNAAGWRPEFATTSNQGALMVPSGDGSSVAITVLNESYKRAMWGGFYPGDGVDEDEFDEALGASLPMKPGAKYTMVFDLTLGDDRVAFGVQVDGRNALMIEGNGQSFWFGWNNNCVDATSDGNQKWTAHIAENTTKRNTQTFAVTVDYDAKTMALYVKEGDVFCFCRSMTYDDANVWDSAYFRCRFAARAIYGTPDENTTAVVSDLTIYKGIDPAFLTADVTVMSYNVHMYDKDDGWEGRDPEKVIDTILDNDPDIIGLQEVNQYVRKILFGITLINEGWNDYLPTLTNNGYARIQGDTSRDCWCELLYKTEKFKDLDSGYKLYSALVNEYPEVDAGDADMGRDNLGRMFTWALLQEKTSGKKVLAISTHLHYRKNKQDTASTDENAAVRQYEVRLLLAWIADQTFEYDSVVIVGDMNAHYLEAVGGRGRRVIDVFRNEGGYAITRDSAAVTEGNLNGTLNYSERTSLVNIYGNTYIYDYILTKGNVETTYFTVVDNKIDYNSNNDLSYPSDHLPILAKMTLY